MVMPEGISGRELAKQLQERKPTLKVVLTSGYSAEIAGRNLVLLPGQVFIQKPCTGNELLATVRTCLDS
jgi:FixJ family two-component response regulator